MRSYITTAYRLYSLRKGPSFCKLCKEIFWYKEMDTNSKHSLHVPAWMKKTHCFSINQEDPAHHNTICIPSNAWYSMLSTHDRREVSKWLGLYRTPINGHDALKFSWSFFIIIELCWFIMSINVIHNSQHTQVLAINPFFMNIHKLLCNPPDPTIYI